MAVDISSLGAQTTQPLDLSIYPEARKRSGLPRAGTYTVQAPEVFTEESFRTAASSGNLSARVDPTIVGPSNEGYNIRYVNVSATVYQTRDGKDTSQIGQYLQAFGVKEELTGDPQQAANLVTETAGKTAQVYADWVAEHRPTGYKLRGMKNFPTDAAGAPQSCVEHPDETVVDAEGNRLRLRANLEVRRWIPAE